jgi:hypothetical protein
MPLPEFGGAWVRRGITSFVVLDNSASHIDLLTEFMLNNRRYLALAGSNAANTCLENIYRFTNVYQIPAIPLRDI